LSTLTVGSYTLNLAGLSTTTEGTFTAWLSMKAENDIENLTFTISYADGEHTQQYTHTFDDGTKLPAGKLLHCNINMETKVAFITDPETGTIWQQPQHVVPEGYDHVVYDEASFLAMPTGYGKRIIQVANIKLTSGLDNVFSGTYNGNGYTITGSSGSYAFDYLAAAQIANVHVLGGMWLANIAESHFFNCSAVGSTLVNNGNPGIFTLCSTDQEKLVNDGSQLIYACWYNNAPQGTQVTEDEKDSMVWDETTKELVEVTVGDLLNKDGSINWNYKYAPTP